jgi:hypothetical protein
MVECKTLAEAGIKIALSKKNCSAKLLLLDILASEALPSFFYYY